MKKRILFICALIALAACQPELEVTPGPNPAQGTEITEDGKQISMVFTSLAGSASLSMKTNRNWTALFVNDRARGWCSLSSEKGGKGTYTLKVTVKENGDYDERSAVILLRCEDLQRRIVVTQKQKDALLLSPGRVELPEEGGEFAIEVKTNVDFTVSIPADASQWLHKVQTKGLTSHKISIEADPNTSLEPRQAALTVNSSLGNETVTVYQTGESPALIISSREMEVPTAGGYFQVQISSNLDVQVQMQPASCDWVEEVKTKMISTHTYYFAAAPNGTGETREMDLVFQNEEYGLSEALHVRQQYQPGFSFTTSRQEVTAPWLKEPGEGVLIFWGDGSFEPYAPDLVHLFPEAGQHTVAIEGDPLAPIRISQLEDGMVIDFSRIAKKEVAQ